MNAFLGIDIGNSHITLGLHDGQAWRGHWRWSTQVHATADEYGLRLRLMLAQLGLAPHHLVGVGLVSVVPALTPVLQQACEAYLGRPAWVLTRETDVGLAFEYDRQQLGLDRVANAVAAYALVADAVCVVDMGTAITVDAIDRQGRFLGGVIAPGPGLVTDVLAARTAQLPPTTLEDVDTPDGLTWLPRSTRDALRSGLVHGLVGMVQHLVQGVREALHRHERERDPEAPAPRVLATGGWAARFAPWLGLEWHPYLTLEGVRRVWLRHREREGEAA